MVTTHMVNGVGVSFFFLQETINYDIQRDTT